MNAAEHPASSKSPPTVITILAGTITGTNLKLANNLAAVLDGPDFRILPVVGKGSVQGALDLLGMHQIDAAFLQSNVIDFDVVRQAHADIDQRIAVIGKMFNEEVHVIAHRSVKRVDDLKGKRVNFGPRTSGGYGTAKMIFDKLGITVDPLELSQLDAPAALRERRIQALCRTVGAPVVDLQAITDEEDLHLLPLPLERIGGTFLPATLVSHDYPGLILSEEPIQTAAVASLLVTRMLPEAHPRRRTIAAFVMRLRDALGRLREGGFHGKWAEATLDAAIPGWQSLPHPTIRRRPG